MTEQQQTGLLPQSNALAEAKTDSLSDYMSRDPMQFTRQDRNRIVEALRAQRARWETAQAAEANGSSKTASGKSLLSEAKAKDLGL